MMRTQNVKIFLMKKCIHSKTVSAYKGYASTYNVGILNSFNPEVQLKVTEFAIKIKLT